MHWHEWNEEAFERARERDCPVLLFLRAKWCQWSRSLASTTLEDERVLALLTERFVCIEVDKDRRPDIDARYRSGGWPTLAWLDADGELIGTDNYLEPEALAKRLELVSSMYPKSLPELRRELAGGSRAEVELEALEPSGGRKRRRRMAELTMEIVEDVTETLIETADPVHGGWGVRHKFPHPEALHFLIVRWTQTGDKRILRIVLRTLRRMQKGQIYDEVEGGFYRYATHADWSVPHHEKMLESNAQRLLAYVEAHQAFGDETFKETASGILNWMHQTLLDPETKAFKGSQDADPEYAHLSTLEARAAHGAPDCDPTVFTHWNAMTVTSLVKAALVLDEDRYRSQALTTLDFLVERLWDEKAGMYHYWDGTYNLPGMLSDQAYTLRAMIDAMHYTGENRYLDRAVQLAHHAIDTLQAEDGSFYDRLRGPQGAGTQRNRSILENAVMAEALLRLSHMSRDTYFAERGRATLESFSSDYKRYGHFVAGYGRAVDLLFHEPVHITIVGSRDSDHTRALREAALRPYVASRIVQTIDPIADPELLERCALPTPEEGSARAYLHQGHESYAETSKPERLPALLARAERSN